ncbi:MAG: hypothetical protein ACR2NP_10415 [Pirellulaceae bacterium]
MAESVQELIYQGNTLICELEDQVEQYHVKSDAHDILKWEIAVVRARVMDLEEQSGLPGDLLDSVLLCDWGYTLAKTIPDLARRVGQFHARYNQYASV